MKDKQILTKAFKKAEKNGYKVSLGISDMDQIVEYGIYYKIIFNHNFARAFFVQEFTGEKLLVRENYYLDCLSEMAREKEPIKYLAKHL